MIEKTNIDMDTPTEKKHSIRFDTPDEDAAIQNVYVAKWWVAAAGGCPNGVRITIAPL